MGLVKITVKHAEVLAVKELINLFKINMIVLVFHNISIWHSCLLKNAITLALPAAGPVKMTAKLAQELVLIELAKLQ